MDSQDIEEILSRLTESQQYHLGRNAGKIFKENYSIQAEYDDIPKDSKKDKKLLQLQRYEQSSVRINEDETAINYVKNHIDLIWKQNPVYLYGNYHPGNLIYTKENSIGVIDFNCWESVILMKNSINWSFLE